ncbi:LptE family protein [candidate division KSB1 bacterium]|nr:LptE family protein [candidate division KSB1 bacterium]
MRYRASGGLLILFGMLFVFSCSYYSLKGSLPPHLNTVAVPLFDNRTPEFGITENLTDAVIDEFIRDGSLKIADRSAADVLITGSIISVNDRAGAFDQQETVQDIKVYISVQVECTDQVKRQAMWNERITQFGSYDPAEGPDGRQNAYEEAYAKLSQEILNKTVSNW